MELDFKWNSPFHFYLHAGVTTLEGVLGGNQRLPSDKFVIENYFFAHMSGIKRPQKINERIGRIDPDIFRKLGFLETMGTVRQKHDMEFSDQGPVFLHPFRYRASTLKDFAVT